MNVKREHEALPRIDSQKCIHREARINLLIFLPTSLSLHHFHSRHDEKFFLMAKRHEKKESINSVSGEKNYCLGSKSFRERERVRIDRRRR